MRSEYGLSVNCVLATRLLCVAVSIAVSMATFRAFADSPAQQQPLGLTATDIARVVDPSMAEWIGKHKGPGAVVVVVKRDGSVFAKGYGFSDIADRKPFTADATLVRPGSISKLFTAIAVMQLLDAGRLDLDRDVNGYIDFAIPTPQGGVPVTLRRLLTHRAGFEEHLKGLFSRHREPAPLGPWLAENLPRRLFPNGDIEAYSNYGFALAGYIIERTAGEPFAAYIERHILDPLGMRHSTFRQPLPDDLAPLMAKGYRVSDKPPLGFFEMVPAPAGGLSATATDMGRFMRALLNGGALDGARILPKARLDEMMAPANATPAGYVGLAFMGRKVGGHEAVGHDGGTMTFFSDLNLFTDEDVGIFVSRDGIGEIKAVTEIPHPATAIARRFLRTAPVATDAPTATSAADVAGIYHASRRAESSLVRLNEFASQIVVNVTGLGDVRVFPAIWPFGDGRLFKHVDGNLYEGPGSSRVAFIKGDDAESYIAQPGIRLQRVSWWLDVRWIAPTLALSVAVVLLTLLLWPVGALWRRWHKRRWSEDRSDRRKYLVVRLVLLVDAAVMLMTTALFLASADLSIFNAALDPLLLALYALAWLGVFGAIPTLWAAIAFWRHGIGGRWSRIHHSLIAASSLMIAWFFFIFRIAGTTLNY